MSPMSLSHKFQVCTTEIWHARRPWSNTVSAHPLRWIIVLYDLKKCQGKVVEQIIRPTGLVDPIIYVKPAKTQVDDLLKQIKKRAQKKERVLVTTLTKRLAEDLSEYIKEEGLKGMYL